MNHLRWGILGTGNIAGQFAEGVTHAHRSRIAAVGSRTRRAAEDFAERFEIPGIHSSYAELLADPAVDAVYVSLPNSMHYEWTIRALEAGKHVLCEKPLASNAREAEQMFEAAERHNRLLVEAFMYRSHPLMHRVLERVREGAVGQVKLIRTSFCYNTKRIAQNVRFDPQLAGGSLMDVGCYCLSLARLIAGSEPEQVCATGHLHATGVDDYVAGTLRFPGGVLASFSCGITVQADNTAVICGDAGYIEIPIPWKPPVNRACYLFTSMTPPRQEMPIGRGSSREMIEVDAHLPLYALEADDFALAVLEGKRPAVSRQDTLGNMRVLDTLREQVGMPQPAAR